MASLVVFGDESIALDRILIGKNQLAAYPNKLIFGKVCVYSNLQPNFVPESAFTVWSHEFSKLVETFCYFQDLKFEDDGENREFKSEAETSFDENIVYFEDNQLVIGVSKSAREKYLLLQTTNIDYKFNSICELKDAIMQLIWLPYCYPTSVNNVLDKIILSTESPFYDNFSEKLLFELLSNLNVTEIDYYQVFKIVNRHKELCQKLSFIK